MLEYSIHQVSIQEIEKKTPSHSYKKECNSELDAYQVMERATGAYSQCISYSVDYKAIIL